MWNDLPGSLKLYTLSFVIETKKDITVVSQLNHRYHDIVADIFAILELDAKEKLLGEWLEEHQDLEVLRAYQDLTRMRTAACPISSEYLRTLMPVNFISEEDILLCIGKDLVRYKALLPFVANLLNDFKANGLICQLGDRTLNYEQSLKLKILLDKVILECYNDNWFDKNVVDALLVLFPLDDSIELAPSTLVGMFQSISRSEKHPVVVLKHLLYAKYKQQYVKYPYVYRQRIEFKFFNYLQYKDGNIPMVDEQMKYNRQIALKVFQKGFWLLLYRLFVTHVIASLIVSGVLRYFHIYQLMKNHFLFIWIFYFPDVLNPITVPIAFLMIKGSDYFYKTIRMLFGVKITNIIFNM